MNHKITLLALTGASLFGLTLANGALVGHYTFEELTGPGSDNVSDSTSQGAYLDGGDSPGASTLIATGGFDGGGYTRLDNATAGNNQYWVSGADVGSTQWSATPRIVGGQARTFAFWVRADSTQFDNGDSRIALFSYGSNNGADTGQRLELNFPLAGGSGLTLDGLRVEVNNGGADKLTIGTDFADGNWHHVAMTVPLGGELGEIELYVDGSSIGTMGSSTVAINTADSRLIIGNSRLSSDRGFTGDFDEFRMYNTVLTAGEISALAVVPEPSAFALIGGLLALGLVVTRRRS